MYYFQKAGYFKIELNLNNFKLECESVNLRNTNLKKRNFKRENLNYGFLNKISILKDNN